MDPIESRDFYRIDVKLGKRFIDLGLDGDLKFLSPMPFPGIPASAISKRPTLGPPQGERGVSSTFNKHHLQTPLPCPLVQAPRRNIMWQSTATPWNPAAQGVNIVVKLFGFFSSLWFKAASFCWSWSLQTATDRRLGNHARPSTQILIYNL